MGTTISDFLYRSSGNTLINVVGNRGFPAARSFRHGLHLGGNLGGACRAPTSTTLWADADVIEVARVARLAVLGHNRDFLLFCLMEGRVLVPNPRWLWVSIFHEAVGEQQMTPPRNLGKGPKKSNVLFQDYLNLINLSLGHPT